MPQERPAPQNPGAGNARLHRWMTKNRIEVCAECGVAADDRTRFSFCPGAKKRDAEPGDPAP